MHLLLLIKIYAFDRVEAAIPCYLGEQNSCEKEEINFSMPRSPKQKFLGTFHPIDVRSPVWTINIVNGGSKPLQGQGIGESRYNIISNSVMTT